MKILGEGLGRVPVRLCGYCLMGNHWHLLLWNSRETMLISGRCSVQCPFVFFEEASYPPDRLTV